MVTGTLAIFHGPRRLRTVILAKQEDNAEGDFADAFIALDPDSAWRAAGGAAAAPPAPYPVYAYINLNPSQKGSVKSCAT